MNREPVSTTTAVTGAIVATISLLAFVGVEPEVIGGISAAATAWVVVAGMVVRGKVTPVNDPVLTPEQHARTTVQPQGP